MVTYVCCKNMKILGGNKMKFGKSLTAGLLVSALLGGNALAATSSTTISSNQSSAYGSDISVNLGVSTTLKGSNYSSSTNNVYIQKIRSITGPDDVTHEFKIAPGNSSSAYTTTGKTGSYHVGMNPEGAYSKGVNGTASLVR